MRLRGDGGRLKSHRLAGSECDRRHLRARDRRAPHLADDRTFQWDRRAREQRGLWKVDYNRGGLNGRLRSALQHESSQVCSRPKMRVYKCGGAHFSVVQLTKLAIPHLIKSKGTIVNVSSLAGIRNTHRLSFYSMTKTALDAFTRVLAYELAEKQVRVNSIKCVRVKTVAARQRREIAAQESSLRTFFGAPA